MFNLPVRRILTLLAAVPLIFAAAVPLSADEAAFRWVDGPAEGMLDLKYGDEPVLRYMHAWDPQRHEETYKPYHHVFGPGTGTLITKGPGGLYTHHRGLYVGWNKTQADGKSFDFWHCPRGVHQKHVRFIEKKADAGQAAMAAEIHWNDADGEPVIVETRRVTVSKLPADDRRGWQIDWQTTLASRRGEIRLDGDRQHAGFQFRAAQPVADSQGARFIRPEGFPQQPQAVQVGDAGDPPPHIDLNWFAMTYELEGERYTVEYLEDPSLPRPSLYSERPYGRFGAFFRATVAPDRPLTMRYRVNVTAGEPASRDEIQGRYDAFTADLEPGRQK